MKSMIWNVKALKMGDLTVEKSTLTYCKNYGEKIKIPMWAIAIYGNGYKILVDTGIDECEWIIEKLSPCERTPEENIISSIKKHLDWSPEDVDIIINTHLHHDHCGENRSFPNARFYVQEQEFLAAMNPAEHQKKLYKKDLYDQNAVNYFDWVFLKGDDEILPGIKVIQTPGHSVGQQSVLVNTEEGILCITGDVANLVENVNELTPVTFAVSIVDELESLKKIRSIADYMIPGHDPSIVDGQTSQFPVVHKMV